MNHILWKMNKLQQYFPMIRTKEEVLKEIKESLTSEDDEEDSSTSTLKDYYMDNVIELVADQVVDEVGTNFTQQLYEQMKRNYNIE